MGLHHSTFQYLTPTTDQMEQMQLVRGDFEIFVKLLDYKLPEGQDKDHVIRLIRDAAMWSNVCITREADGAPRN
jgi:hypothetical protein